MSTALDGYICGACQHFISIEEWEDGPYDTLANGGCLGNCGLYMEEDPDAGYLHSTDEDVPCRGHRFEPIEMPRKVPGSGNVSPVVAWTA
jgi:hypothetical protein